MKDKLTIENVKEKDTFYNVVGGKISYHTYAHVHPNNKSYHIIIDDFQNPERWYVPKLEKVLSLNCLTYADALKLSIQQIQQKLDMYKQFLEEELHKKVK